MDFSGFFVSATNFVLSSLLSEAGENELKFINAIMTMNHFNIYDIHNYVTQFPLNASLKTFVYPQRISEKENR